MRLGGLRPGRPHQDPEPAASLQGEKSPLLPRPVADPSHAAPRHFCLSLLLLSARFFPSCPPPSSALPCLACPCHVFSCRRPTTCRRRWPSWTASTTPTWTVTCSKGSSTTSPPARYGPLLVLVLSLPFSRPPSFHPSTPCPVLLCVASDPPPYPSSSCPFDIPMPAAPPVHQRQVARAGLHGGQHALRLALPTQQHRLVGCRGPQLGIHTRQPVVHQALPRLVTPHFAVQPPPISLSPPSEPFLISLSILSLTAGTWARPGPRPRTKQP